MLEEEVTKDQSEDKMTLLCNAGHTEATRGGSPARAAHTEGSPIAVMLTSAVRDKFNKFDLDRSGSLGMDEVVPLLVELGGDTMGDEQIEAALAELDADGSVRPTARARTPC